MLQAASCGRPLPGYQVRVMDTAGNKLGERREGRIEFTGPSATPGYFRNEAATRALRRGPWVDTGDLGYLADGELYLTGRVKDIVVRRGRNLHPDEAEQGVGRLAGVEHGGVAAFGCPDPGTGTERLVLVAETRLHDAGELAALNGGITALATTLLGIPPDEVVLAAPGSVLTTASGLTRRAATRDRYLAGTLGRPGPGGTLAGGPVRPLGPASWAARRRPVRSRPAVCRVRVGDHRGGGRPGLAARHHAAWPAGALGSAPCGGAAAAPAISRPAHRDRGDNRRRQPVRYCR
ncbi:MAG: hypothetical protein ACLP5E_15770 [Streptosporangiaceae bacterium]